MIHGRAPFELVIGLVGGVGTNFEHICHQLKSGLEYTGCNVEIIKITKFLNDVQNDNDFLTTLEDKIKAMNAARHNIRCDIGAFVSINHIFNARIKSYDSSNNIKPTVYIIDSLKHPKEYDALRDVYRRNFILISIFEQKENRKRNLLAYQLKSKKTHQSISCEDEDRIKQIMNSDEKDAEPCGRDTRGTYHKAHYFVQMDLLNDQLQRLIKLIFNDPFNTPSRDETGMLHAYFSSLRSSDPSRQVGAVITDYDGNILASGCNEVPKFGGGLHWDDTKPDRREFATIDDNRVSLSDQTKNGLNNGEKYFEDSLEFIRAVHAEEAAICDAACRGVALKNSRMYCTTFPCHLCIKHIIAAGIIELVYIEPYPKSKAKELYNGLIKDKCTSEDENLVKLRPFIGVAPKRYRYIFSKTKLDRRQPNSDRIIDWDIKTAKPVYLSHSTPISYFWSEYYYLDSYPNETSNYFYVTKGDLKVATRIFFKIAELNKKFLNDY